MQAAAPVEAPAAQLGTGAAPMEEDVVPSAVEDHSIKQLTADEVLTSAAAETVMAAAVEKAVDASEILSISCCPMVYELTLDYQCSDSWPYINMLCISSVHYALCDSFS